MTDYEQQQAFPHSIITHRQSHLKVEMVKREREIFFLGGVGVGGTTIHVARHNTISC